MNTFENFKFTFETDEAYEKAERTGYVPDFDMVRMVVENEEGSVDFPVRTREELIKLYEGFSIAPSVVVKVYPSVHYYDINDYVD